MKIVLTCSSCEEKGGQFVSTLELVEPGQGVRTSMKITSRSPLLVGSYYYLMLKGIFPGFQENRPCVSDEFGGAEIGHGDFSEGIELPGLTTEQWTEWITDRQEKGKIIW